MIPIQIGRQKTVPFRQRFRGQALVSLRRQRDSLHFGLQCLQQLCGLCSWKWLLARHARGRQALTESPCRHSARANGNVFLTAPLDLGFLDNRVVLYFRFFDLSGWWIWARLNGDWPRRHDCHKVFGNEIEAGHEHQDDDRGEDDAEAQ